MEQYHRHEPTPEIITTPSSGELLSAAHFLTMNAYSFAIMHEDGSQDLPSALATEFLDKFSQVARPRMAPTYVKERFSAQADLADVFDAIDTELRAWARGGVVESQVAPLAEYVQWLIDAHTEDMLSMFEDETRLVVERRLALATARVRHGTKDLRSQT